MDLRPQTLNDYIGQSHVKELIKTAILATNIRDTVLDHTLLTGPSGVGKTTLAFIIANELGTKAHILNAAGVENHDEVRKVILSMNEGDILFIDEIHRLPVKIEEFLYHPMEDSVIEVSEEVTSLSPIGSFVLDTITANENISPFLKYEMREGILKGATKGHVTTLKKIPPITIIGATTRAGGLTKPLRDRFTLSVGLEQYNEDDLDLITKQKADMLDIDIEKDASRSIAKRGRGTARIVTNYVKRCLDTALVQGYNIITVPIVETTLNMLGVDPIGLTNVDINYLKLLAKDKKPRGVRAISASINEDIPTIEEVIEPYLVQIGFIERTPRGRVITSEGEAYVR